MMTAYFAPEYPARAYPDAEFSAPVRPRPGQPAEAAPPPPADPNDLIATVLAQAEAGAAPPPGPATRMDLATADRAAIERLPGDGALAWMRPEDLFFLQIQGSGVLTFPDGRKMRAAYASDNGKPFVAIARPMVNQKLLGATGASGEAIRAWLAAHRGPEAQAVMQLNPRYVFFALSPDDGREPAGAAGIPLPAGRAIAVDPGRHTYGEMFWIDASAPVLTGGFRSYRRLVMALDTGNAIRGEVRADLYIGRGAAAGTEAGRVRHSLRMTRLVPIAPETHAGSAWRETAAATGGG
jgi:membrane-bound lytic murein transglycosylase A